MMINPAKTSRKKNRTAPISRSRLKSDDDSRSMVDWIVERKFCDELRSRDEAAPDEPEIETGENSFWFPVSRRGRVGVVITGVLVFICVGEGVGAADCVWVGVAVVGIDVAVVPTVPPTPV